MMADRVGLGWRGELAASILERLVAIDVLEVIAEDWTRAPREEQRALAALGRERPLLLHGVAMGLASCHRVDPRRLDDMARLVEVVRPELWSEHLAFVRAGGVEIGHLAAPPRTAASVDGTLENLRRAARVVGALPLLENIATLVDPPASTLDEPAWTRAIVAGSGSPMLLDLHNLYANAVNFGHDPMAMLRAMPLESVRLVHLSGGRWLTPHGVAPRLLDDHLNDVPDPVYGLLAALAARAQGELTVILERDGNYPAIGHLVAQLDRARRALAEGRARALGRAA
ncbi:MAG: DUF692 domain-containing protein [Betaproteobacteria bacterium]|nr:DUF692 domain-containing protein [Betaproteobacteria bacterium]PWB60429.1 MAG: hypothetical protein C3F16_10320 [Betaproteobacteria bacterium]